jgi:hypothetical protein
LNEALDVDACQRVVSAPNYPEGLALLRCYPPRLLDCGQPMSCSSRRSRNWTVATINHACCGDANFQCEAVPRLGPPRVPSGVNVAAGLAIRSTYLDILRLQQVDTSGSCIRNYRPDPGRYSYRVIPYMQSLFIATPATRSHGLEILEFVQQVQQLSKRALISDIPASPHLACAPGTPS